MGQGRIRQDSALLARFFKGCAMSQFEEMWIQQLLVFFGPFGCTCTPRGEATEAARRGLEGRAVGHGIGGEVVHQRSEGHACSAEVQGAVEALVCASLEQLPPTECCQVLRGDGPQIPRECLVHNLCVDGCFSDWWAGPALEGLCLA